MLSAPPPSTDAGLDARRSTLSPLVQYMTYPGNITKPLAPILTEAGDPLSSFHVIVPAEKSTPPVRALLELRSAWNCKPIISTPRTPILILLASIVLADIAPPAIFVASVPCCQLLRTVEPLIRILPGPMSDVYALMRAAGSKERATTVPRGSPPGSPPLPPTPTVTLAVRILPARILFALSVFPVIRSPLIVLADMCSVTIEFVVMLP